MAFDQNKKLAELDQKEAAAISALKNRIADYERQLSFKEADAALAKVKLDNAKASLAKREAK